MEFNNMKVVKVRGTIRIEIVQEGNEYGSKQLNVIHSMCNKCEYAEVKQIEDRRNRF